MSQAKTSIFKQLSTQFPEQSFVENFLLAKRTYFKIGGAAEVFLKIADEEKVAEIYGWCVTQKIPVTLFGGASNVLIEDAGIQGLVIHLTNDYCDLIPNSSTKIKVGAGCKTALMVGKSIQLGLTGLEFFLGVPGTVGGAIYNNAHYLEELIGKYIYRVKVAQADGTIRWINHSECEFEYEKSRFQTSKELILSAEFELPLGNAQNSRDLIAQATRYRANTQPLGEPSSGCIFQNVLNSEQLQQQFPQFKDRTFVGGGFLIDQAGLKGTRIGGISVSHKHAAFFVNDGTGTSKQVKELIELVKNTVAEKFNINLKEEVFILK